MPSYYDALLLPRRDKTPMFTDVYDIALCCYLLRCLMLRLVVTRLPPRRCRHRFRRHAARQIRRLMRELLRRPDISPRCQF